MILTFLFLSVCFLRFCPIVLFSKWTSSVVLGPCSWSDAVTELVVDWLLSVERIEKVVSEDAILWSISVTNQRLSAMDPPQERKRN